MSEFQDSFTDALLNPDLATPSGLVDPKGRVAGKRFDVYRNNVSNPPHTFPICPKSPVWN